MSFLSSIGGLLQQYASGNTPAGNVEDHFDQVAHSVPCSSMASGLAAAFRSGDTAPFSQLASQLFANGNGGQQASMLNTLMATAGPALLSSFTGGNSGGGALSSLLHSGQTQVTPEQAAAVSPDEVQALAEHVHQHDPSIIDRVSEVYAEHPTLIKTLGAGVMALAMKRMSESH